MSDILYKPPSGTSAAPVPSPRDAGYLPTHALMRPRPGEKPTPWFAWPLAILVALIGSFSVFHPILGIAVAVALFSYWVITRTVERPLRGVFIALWIFPWYPIIRAAIWCFYPDLPLFASRFWLEGILATMSLGVLLRVLIYRQHCRLVTDDLPIFGLLFASLYGLIPTILDRVYIDLAFGIYYCVTPILAYFAVRWIAVTAPDLRRIINTVFLTFGCLAFVSLLDYTFHPEIMLRILEANRNGFYHGGVDNVRVIVTQFNLRMNSLLLEENFWGAVCCFVSLLVTARIATGRAKWFTYVIFALSVLGLLLSMSRGALVGWLAGLAALVLLHRQRRFRAFVLILGLIGGGWFVGTVQLQDEPHVVQFMSRFSVAANSNGTWSNGNLDGRAIQWDAAKLSFQQTPSGVGVGSSGFATMYTGARPAIVTDGHYFHVAVEQGVVGLIFWGLGLPGMLWVLYKRAQNTTDPELRSLGIGLGAELVALCVHGISGNVFDYYYTPALFFLLYGLLINVTNQKGSHLPRATERDNSGNA